MKSILDNPTFKDECVNSTKMTPLSGCTPLGFAVFSNNLDSAKALMDDPRTDVLQKGGCGRSVFDFFTQDNVPFAVIAFKRLKKDMKDMHDRDLSSDRSKLAKARQLMRWWEEKQSDWKNEIAAAQSLNRKLARQHTAQAVEHQQLESLMRVDKVIDLSPKPEKQDEPKRQTLSPSSVEGQRKPANRASIASLRERSAIASLRERSAIAVSPGRPSLSTLPKFGLSRRSTKIGSFCSRGSVASSIEDLQPFLASKRGTVTSIAEEQHELPRSATA